MVSNRLSPPVCPFYLGKEVYLVVGLPEVVLYVVVLGWYAQFDELLLESARLLEEAVYSSVDFHNSLLLLFRCIILYRQHIPVREVIEEVLHVADGIVGERRVFAVAASDDLVAAAAVLILLPR